MMEEAFFKASLMHMKREFQEDEETDWGRRNSRRRRREGQERE